MAISGIIASLDGTSQEDLVGSYLTPLFIGLALVFGALMVAALFVHPQAEKRSTAWRIGSLPDFMVDKTKV